MITAAELSNSELAIYNRLKEAIFAEINVAKPGIVVPSTPDYGLLTVQPINKQRIIDARGNASWIDYPAIPDVIFAGDKPAVGSAVLLIFCDDDTSTLISSSGTDSAGAPVTQVPQLLSKHSMSHAVAITLSAANVTGTPKTTTYGVTSSGTASMSTTYTPIDTGSLADTGIGISERGLLFIEAWEGFGNGGDWYWDKLGSVWTIGYGYTSGTKTLPSGYTAPLTQGAGGTGEALLKQIVTSYISGVTSAFSSITLTQNQKDALISFAWNLGAGIFPGTKLQSDIIVGADSLQLKKDFDAFANATIDGVLTPIKGLLDRRDAEWSIFCSGVYLGP